MLQLPTILFSWARRILTGLGLLVVIVTCTPVDYWWVSHLMGPWTEARGDVLIVLTGDILGNGMIGETSFWRGTYAVLAWREGGWRQVVVAGGGGGPVPIAQGLKGLLLAGGIPESAIRLETASNSTRQNALNVQAMLAGVPGRKVLLTSDYHMYRAWRVFRKIGMEVTPRPIPDAGKRSHAWNMRWCIFLDLTVETVKSVYYYCRGWI